jgi:hypothetical protein
VVKRHVTERGLVYERDTSVCERRRDSDDMNKGSMRRGGYRVLERRRRRRKKGEGRRRKEGMREEDGKSRMREKKK